MSFTLMDWVGVAISSAFAFFVFGNISSKAGYPRWHGLVMAIPLLNLLALLIFAYSTWPIEGELLKSKFRSSSDSQSQ